MKATIKIEKEVEVKTLCVSAGVRYWEDSEVNGESDTEEGEAIPCKVDKCWCPEIDVNTGIILNWTQGVTASIHYKVCDAGTYILRDAEGNQLCEADGYVPDCLCPKEEGYGDYIIMDIDKDGKIQDWEFGQKDIAWLMDQE